MGHKIDQFCEDLRQKLTSIDTDLGSVKSKIEGSVQGVEEEARKHLETVERRIEADRAKVAAAKTE
ncbi:hypothetical protein C1X77_27020, partial [Pseudomonas sp. GW531-E2]|uniref:hypothetical protein n=1 Tax=Pseudomonas sp. GW531-E2 TaxID=2070679 RepID=UPI000CB9AA44